MRAYAIDNGIGPTSEIEVVVVRIVSCDLRRARKEEGFYDKTYVEFEEIPPREWMLACPEPVEAVVWSSKVAGSLTLADAGEGT